MRDNPPSINLVSNWVRAAKIKGVKRGLQIPLAFRLVWQATYFTRERLMYQVQNRICVSVTMCTSVPVTNSN